MQVYAGTPWTMALGNITRFVSTPGATESKEVVEKTCPRCKRTLSITKFAQYWDSGRQQYRRYYQCQACNSARKRERRKLKREAQNASRGH